MRYLLAALSFAWQLPVAAPIWLCYLLPAWGLGWLKRGTRPGLGAVWFVVPYDDGPAWWHRAWQGWVGHALPYAIVTAHYTDQILLHERRHVRQWAILGPLFPLVYLALLAIYDYHRHPLEVDARKAAGQPYVRRWP